MAEISPTPLLQPNEISIKDASGKDRSFILSKIPATAAREIMAKYLSSSIPKVGDYRVNEETMFKLLSYVAVDAGGQILPLTTRALVDNHTGDWETLIKLEDAMVGYNCSFFPKGTLSSFLIDGVQTLRQKALEILTPFLALSSAQGKPPSTS